jgi:hypothetical protein
MRYSNTSTNPNKERATRLFWSMKDDEYTAELFLDDAFNFWLPLKYREEAFDICGIIEKDIDQTKKILKLLGYERP